MYIFENLVLTYYESDKIIIREGNYANSIMFLIYGKALITKARSPAILRHKRFRHINNRQREFFKTDKIVEENVYENDDDQEKECMNDESKRKSSLHSAAKSSFFLDRQSFGEIASMRGAYKAQTIGEYNRLDAQEAGIIASGSYQEMSNALNEEEDFERNRERRLPKLSLYQRLSFISPSGNRKRAFDERTKAKAQDCEVNVNEGNSRTPRSTQRRKSDLSFTKMKDFFNNDPNEDLILGELNAGQFCGHVAMMNKGGKHNASVVSLQPCTFYSLTRHATYRILEEQPCVAIVLEHALGEAISDLKTESESQRWWANNRTFIKDVHMKHVKFKTGGNMPSSKKRNTLTGNLIPIKIPNRYKISKSLRRALNTVTRVVSSSVYPQRDTPSDIADAEARWDRVRRLIKKSKATAKLAASTRGSPQLNTGEKSEFKDGEPSTTSVLESKALIDSNQALPPPRRLNSSMFSEALRYDLGSALLDLVNATLTAPIDQLEAEEEALLPPSSFRRIKSLPNIGSDEEILPPSIHEGLKLANTVKVQPSIFCMRRRQSFPAADSEIAIWKKDKKYLHII